MFAYLITNTVNRKRYIGVARNTADRWRRHIRAAQGDLPHYALHMAMAKYGSHVFTFEVVACARSWDDLLEAERLLIEQHNTRLVGGHGYNMTGGGDGTIGYRHSDEAKAIIRAARLKWTVSAETVAKISAANRGKKRSPEQVERYRAASKLRGFTPEAREKARLARLGTPLSAETKAKLSAVRRGKPKSLEHRAAIGKANLGRVFPPEFGAKISATKRARAKPASQGELGV